MQIKIDDNGYIVGYAIIGDISGGTDYHGDTPPDFKENYYAYKLQDGQLIFCPERIAQRTAHETLQAEYSALIAWFDDYDLQASKWMRGVRMMRPRDDIDMTTLDTQAEEKRKRINEIRQELGV